MSTRETEREKAKRHFSRFVYKNDLCSHVSATIIALLRGELCRWSRYFQDSHARRLFDASPEMSEAF